MLLLVGCDRGREDNLPTEPIEFGFSDGDLEEIFFEDIEGDLLIDLSANTEIREILSGLCYTDGEATVMPSEGGRYFISFGGKAFTVFADGAVWYDDGVNAPKSVILSDSGLSYLDGVTSGEAFALCGYSEDAKITVHDGNNLKAEITEKGEFLANLNEVKVIKLLNGGDYLLSEVDYSIKIGEETIKVYGDFVKLGEELYAILEGDFDFLSDYTYKSDSSGFLPWV